MRNGLNSGATASSTCRGPHALRPPHAYSGQHVVVGSLCRLVRRTSACQATIRCATCSRCWIRSCSKRAFSPGSVVCATTILRSSPLMGRPRGAVTTGGRAEIPRTFSQPGRRGNASLGRRPRRNPNEVTAIPLLLKHLDLKGARDGCVGDAERHCPR
jgi:hypothetical protein